VRGGAIPNFLWGTGLLALLTANAIWAQDPIQIYMNAFAVCMTFGVGFLFTWRSRSAIRKGPPTVEDELEAAPATSLAAAILGVAIGAMLFGIAFGRFLVFMGAGLWLLAFGRLIVEIRAQRRTVRRFNQGHRR
jgi:fatty acid desaturase